MSDDLAAVLRASLADELTLLRDELRALVEPLTEAEFWSRPLPASNSVGHLVLHLTGNLNHFVGAQLGSTGYVRDRAREFSEPNPPAKETALARLDDAITQFRRIVGGMSPERLTAPHPESRLGTIVQALIHLVAHFALHRGQASYLVRLVRTPL